MKQAGKYTHRMLSSRFGDKYWQVIFDLYFKNPEQPSRKLAHKDLESKWLD